MKISLLKWYLKRYNQYNFLSFSVIGLFLFLTCCNGGDSIQNRSLFEGRFKYKNVKNYSIENIKRENDFGEYNLTELSANEKERFFPKQLRNKFSLENFEMYYYSYNHFESDLPSAVIFYVGEGYKGGYIFFMNEDGEIFSEVEIFGGECFSPEELDNGRVLWCPERKSELFSDTSLCVSTTFSESDGFEIGSAEYITTIKKSYSLVGKSLVINSVDSTYSVSELK